MAVTFWVLVSLLMPPIGPVIAKKIKKAPDYQQFVNHRHSLLSEEAEKTYKESKNRLKDINTQEEGSKLMAEVLDALAVSPKGNPEVEASVRARVSELTKAFPLYPDL